jgi:hypothetical protein
MGEDKQKRFSNLCDHIMLKPEIKKMLPSEKKKGRKKGHFPQQSIVEYSDIANKLSSVINQKIS